MDYRIHNIKSISTWDPLNNKLVSKRNKEIFVSNGKIKKIDEKVSKTNNDIDAKNCILTPGFIDSHTHPIFIGNRANELAMRVSGKSYEQIAKEGGGILSSISNLRKSKFEDLFKISEFNICNFFKNGTTILEAKSGYGLTVEDEIKSLEVIKKLNEKLPIEIISTFLGAHAIPPEYVGKKDQYVNLICNEMIPAVAEKQLAEFCDVFCEKGYFNYDQSLKILETAKQYGMTPRLHADEFVDSCGAKLAADIKALSADHLMAISDEGIASLKNTDVIATLLPGTTYFLGKREYANGRKLIDSGIEVALATDFNPGSCTINSLSMIMQMAVLYCGLTIEEAFKGVTWNAAKSLNRHFENGIIENEYNADFILWDIQSLDEIPYWFGNDRIASVYKKGLQIYSKS